MPLRRAATICPIGHSRPLLIQYCPSPGYERRTLCAASSDSRAWQRPMSFVRVHTMVKTVRKPDGARRRSGVSAVVGWVLLRESKRSKIAERIIVRSRAHSTAAEPVAAIVLPLDKIALDLEQAPPLPP